MNSWLLQNGNNRNKYQNDEASEFDAFFGPTYIDDELDDFLEEDEEEEQDGPDYEDELREMDPFGEDYRSYDLDDYDLDLDDVESDYYESLSR